jgi:hypothetical protein
MRRFTGPRVLPEHQPLESLLGRFKYRPDWKFEIFDDQLLIKATVISADNHKELIPLQFGIGLPMYVRPDFDWTHWLFQQIMTVERHEVEEFFQIGGVKVFDPHAGEGS